MKADGNISIIDFIKKKYNFDLFPHFLETFFFGTVTGILLYFMIYFKNDLIYYIIIMGTFSTYLMLHFNHKYKKEYVDKIEIITFKIKDIQKQFKNLKK